MEKFLLFTTGGGSTDPMNLDSSEIALYNVSSLRSIKAASKSTLVMLFQVDGEKEIVTLTVRGGSHGIVIRSITNAIMNDNQIIKIADVDEDVFINKHISGVAIKTSTPILYKNKILNNTAVEIIDINTKLKRLNSMTLANVHSAAATVQVYLLDAAGILYYIIKDVVIPVGSTLKLESDELDYDASLYNLYVKLAASTPIDVIVR